MHNNARLTPQGRYLLVQRVTVWGLDGTGGRGRRWALATADLTAGWRFIAPAARRRSPTAARRRSAVPNEVPGRAHQRDRGPASPADERPRDRAPARPAGLHGPQHPAAPLATANWPRSSPGRRWCATSARGRRADPPPHQEARAHHAGRPSHCRLPFSLARSRGSLAVMVAAHHAQQVYEPFVGWCRTAWRSSD
jgi:hypothetical protein